MSTIDINRTGTLGSLKTRQRRDLPNSPYIFNCMLILLGHELTVLKNTDGQHVTDSHCHQYLSQPGQSGSLNQRQHRGLPKSPKFSEAYFVVKCRHLWTVYRVILKSFERKYAFYLRYFQSLSSPNNNEPIKSFISTLGLIGSIEKAYSLWKN